MTIELRAYQFRNNARSALQSAIAADDTQIVVEEGKGDAFPVLAAGEIFSVILWNTSITRYEVVYCIARSGDVLTVERGKEGTSPGIFGVGSIVVHNVTAGFYQQLASPQPTTPVLSSNLVGTEIDLSWTESFPVIPSAVITQYDIYRAVGAGAFAFLASVLAADPREYTDSGLASATTYHYYVVAIADVGPTSANSNTVSETIATETTMMFVRNDASARYTLAGGFVATGDPGTLTTPRAVAYSPSLTRWALCGTSPGKVAVSDNQGTTWADKVTGLAQNYEKMVYAFGAFWMGSNNGSCFTSANAEAPWTARMTGNRAYGVAYSAGENRVACCGDENGDNTVPTIQYADSLTTMSNGSVAGLLTGGGDPSNTLYAIGRDDSRGKWWVIDGHGNLYSTSDIVAGTWALMDTVDAVQVTGHAAIAFKPNGAIVVATGGNGLWVSTDDGATFVEQLGTALFEDVHWSDFLGLFFAVGDDTLTSADGASWSTASLNGYTAIGEG